MHQDSYGLTKETLLVGQKGKFYWIELYTMFTVVYVSISSLIELQNTELGTKYATALV